MPLFLNSVYKFCVKLSYSMVEIELCNTKKNMVLLYFEDDIRVLRAFVILCSFLLGEIFEIFIPGIIQHYPQSHDYFNKV
jgi:hypothetical protein